MADAAMAERPHTIGGKAGFLKIKKKPFHNLNL